MEDECTLVELKWKAAEVKKIENKARSNRKRTHRRSAPDLPNCERASCYARANLPRTVPKSCWSWPVANRKESVLTCTVVSPNTMGVHVPRRLYACLVKTEVPN